LKAEGLRLLAEQLGGSYSRRLGLKISEGNEKTLFLWFLASILYGAPIGEKTAEKTFRLFVAAGLTSPKRILDAGWDRLVEILDSGGYTRYDFKTADKLLEMCGTLKKKYGCSLLKLHREASGSEDLEAKLKSLAKGIGPATVSIFLREASHVLSKAEPLPSPYEVLAARNLKISNLKGENRQELRKILKEISDAWRLSGLKCGFPDFRAALLRLGRDYCRKGKCEKCPVSRQCPSFHG
jgi:endonuclease III